MQVIKEGSVRVDLVGGTLDLDPIHVILKDVITLNVATSLKAKVIIERIDTNSIIIESLDYNSVSEFQEEEFTYENIYENDHFGPLKFFIQILDHFKIHKGLKIISNSGAPAGSGLGGSSAMGVTLYSAILDMQKRTEDRVTIVNTVKGIESRILNQGVAGYQDFYPALFGGVLGLKAAPGEVVVEQLYSQELKVFLEKNITLIFSGKSRQSGMNNWEAYKLFFEKDAKVRQGFADIAEVSHKTYEAIKQKSYQDLPKLIGQEGEIRKNLFPGIFSEEITTFYDTMKKELPEAGLKVCGAGGGGCFIVSSGDQEKVASIAKSLKMEVLEFKIDNPL